MATQNHGIVKSGAGQAHLTSVPIPRLRDDYILVKNIAVALNPADWQNLDEEFRPGTTRSLLGHDAAGIVVGVGKNVTKAFRKGDRIAGFSHGGNDLEIEDGTFAEYIVLKGDIAMHIPDSITFEEAATLGCGIATIGLGLYKHLDLAFPTLPIKEPKRDGPPILIYGGSSATGTLAIQFAKLSGLNVIATSSPKNFTFLKTLGADHVFDYRDPNCGQKIRDLTSNKLGKVFDTIATLSSAQICSDALSSSGGGIYVNLMGIEMPRKDVKNIFFLGYTVRGETFDYEGELWPASREDFDLGKRVFTMSEKLLENELITVHPVCLREGGLSGILNGMKELREGKVSGVKLVYRIGEFD